MNGRERLLATFKREEVDRVPISPYLYCNAVYEMFGYEPDIDTFWDPPDFDIAEKYVEFCERFGFDVMHIMSMVYGGLTRFGFGGLPVTRAWENWDVTVSEERKADRKRQTIVIRTPDGELKHVEDFLRISRYTVVSAPSEYMIKSKQDFDLMRRYAPPMDGLDCRMVGRVREATGDHGLVVVGGSGAFNALNSFRNLELMMMDPLLDPGFYREMIEFLLDRSKQRARLVIGAGADVFEIGANMATSGVGPEFFARYVLPYEKELIKTVHEAGAFALFHNCGDAAKIMHLYNELDTDCWGYLTPPPFGDVILDDALDVMRQDMVLRGNVDQVEFLMKATPEEIRDSVRELLEKVKPRGNWILCTTDWWADGLPEENLAAFADAGLEYGWY